MSALVFPDRALTLHRPWCWAICHAGKRVENRSWKPPLSLRGGDLLAIHSGLRWDEDAERWLRELHEDSDIVGPVPAPPMKDSWPGGRIVALARCYGYVTTTGAGGSVALDLESIQRARSSEWFAGPVGWVLRDVRVLAESIPCRGAQGLWRVPPAVLEQLRSAA